MAEKYKDRSVAEQNSLDLGTLMHNEWRAEYCTLNDVLLNVTSHLCPAWDNLMEDQYKDFRTLLCNDCKELGRFRQLVINSVMATDLGDKQLKELRNGRWNKAFQEEEAPTEDNPRDQVNRKATIVIEHLIQASDIAHTMQHWHIYKKWNQKLFHEMYNAYKAGRSDKNPAEFWYEGELGFFDFYIIPLAKKLDSCGVFGVSSDENLNYATRNRQEWEARGREVVAEYLEILESGDIVEEGSDIVTDTDEEDDDGAADSDVDLGGGIVQANGHGNEKVDVIENQVADDKQDSEEMLIVVEYEDDEDYDGDASFIVEA